MDLRKLKTLIDLVAESTIAELEVTEGDSKVRIVKSGAHAQMPMQYMQMPMQQMPQAVGVSPAAAAAPVEPAKPAEIEGNVVKAPMVGTFYRSPAPGKPSYVEVGQSVKSAEPICIIEAMKLLNEIESDRDGTVKAILVENGQPVEYGEPLLILS